MLKYSGMLTWWCDLKRVLCMLSRLSRFSQRLMHIWAAGCFNDGIEYSKNATHINPPAITEGVEKRFRKQKSFIGNICGLNLSASLLLNWPICSAQYFHNEYGSGII